MRECATISKAEMVLCKPNYSNVKYAAIEVTITQQGRDDLRLLFKVSNSNYCTAMGSLIDYGHDPDDKDINAAEVAIRCLFECIAGNIVDEEECNRNVIIYDNPNQKGGSYD